MSSISREEIQQYVLTNLGYPIVSVELAPENIGMAIDVAIQEYLSTGAVEIDYKELPNNGTNIYDLPEDVATVKNVQFATPFSAAAGSTEDIFSFAVYASPFGPNYGNFVHAAGNLGVFFEYLQNRNRVIGNDITFKVVDNQLYVWPFPKTASTILIEYSKNAFAIQDADRKSISTSNAWGIQWIRRMTLAICKGMLGKIRGKFSSVSGGPGTEAQTLNSAELIAESKEEMVLLRQDLLDHISHIQFYIS
jgi:hypothetical protein